MHEYELSPTTLNTGADHSINSPTLSSHSSISNHSLHNNPRDNVFASPASSDDAVNSPLALVNISHRDTCDVDYANAKVQMYLQNSPDSSNGLYLHKNGLNGDVLQSPVKTPDSTIGRTCSDSSYCGAIDTENAFECKPKIVTKPRSMKRSVGCTGSDGTCAVCGDRPEGVVYGALSCKSCQGFFKRSIKNQRSYMCIDKRDCVLNKKNRNRCRACRLETCHKVGMSKEVVEQELIREKTLKSMTKKAAAQKGDNATEVTSSLLEPSPNVVDINIISEAEIFVDPKIDAFANVNADPIRQIGLAADKQLTSLAEWAKRMPYFSDLKLVDQVKLLQWNWPDLLVGGFSYRSSAVSGGILLATGVHVSKENIKKAGFRTVINKLFAEVISKIQKYQIDIREWGCLRAIMLFAPDTKDIVEVEQIENIRDRYIATLCEYMRRTYADQPHRVGDLLLILPPLRAISLQILEHLFFFKVIGDVPIDTFLFEMLDVDNH